MTPQPRPRFGNARSRRGNRSRKSAPSCSARPDTAAPATPEQVFFLFQGLGRDGKSTYMGAKRELLGDYAAAADVKTFLDVGQRSGADANPDLARLAGDTRLASTAEPPRGAKLAEAMIKSFTGGAPILARHLRRDLFEFQPIPKIFMECNSFPTIKGDDDGIWRRLVPILWENQVPKDKVDRQLPAKLRNEYSGILNWLLAGVCAWLKDGLNPPTRVAEALEDYRKGSSPFGEWLAEWVVIDKTEKHPATPFYTSFKEWLLARDPDARVMSQQAFGRALADRQILYAGLGGDGRVMRKGARLKTSSEHQTEYALDDPGLPPPPVQGEASPGGSMGGREFAPRDDGPDGGIPDLPTGDWPGDQ
jgi:putative DNA primase/helicase